MSNTSKRTARASQPSAMATLLGILSETTRPTGSRVIHERLLADGFDISESTVGRLLGESDRAGFTKSRGRLGRVLTPAGHRQFQALRDHSSRDHNAKQVLEVLRGGETLNDLRNVIVARRGIEREIAQEAALHATPSDIAALRAQAKRKLPEGIHPLLVRAAHNPFLESVYRLITQDPAIRRMTDQLPEPTGLRATTFDERMIDAIAKHDVARAGQTMLEHMDELVDLVDGLLAKERRTP